MLHPAMSQPFSRTHIPVISAFPPDDAFCSSTKTAFLPFPPVNAFCGSAGIRPLSLSACNVIFLPAGSGDQIFLYSKRSRTHSRDLLLLLRLSVQSSYLLKLPALLLFEKIKCCGTCELVIFSLPQLLPLQTLPLLLQFLSFQILLLFRALRLPPHPQQPHLLLQDSHRLRLC